MSMCMFENLASGVLNLPSGDAVWRCTFDFCSDVPTVVGSGRARPLLQMDRPLPEADRPVLQVIARIIVL